MASWMRRSAVSLVFTVFLVLAFMACGSNSGNPISPEEIFAQVSPSVVFIQTPIGSGSGVLFEDGYVVTNAHVVWPYQEVRVVFPDGSEHLDAPVLKSDPMNDLAVIGPLKTTADPLPFSDGEDLAIGSDVYLIGYPAEGERFPQPAITRGILSRLREWETGEMTYFQTDAGIAGGQSGGVMVSEFGDVVGISGFSFSEALFGLVASAEDLRPRIQRLIAGEDISEVGDRRIPLEGGRLEWDSFLVPNNYAALRTWVINEPVGTKIDVSVERGFLNLIDVYGNLLIGDDDEEGVRYGSVTTLTEGPHFVLVQPRFPEFNDFHLKSNRKLSRFWDPDDATTLIDLNRTIHANLDHPFDIDVFNIDFAKGDIVDVIVDTPNISPVVWIEHSERLEEESLPKNLASIGSTGLNSTTTYRATRSGRHLIAVHDVGGTRFGGYFLTVVKGSTAAASPSPTPSPTAAPVPTPVPTATRRPNKNYLLYRPTPTPIPTATPGPIGTPTPTFTPVPTATSVPTPTATPVPTPTPTPTPTATPRPTPTPTPVFLADARWAARSPVPTARGGLAAETLGNQIHVIAGTDWHGTFQSTVHEVYDPTTDTWTTKASPPDVDMWGATSAVVDGKLFLIGGWAVCKCAPPTLIRAYDPSLDEWEYEPAIPDQGFNYGHATAVVKDEIYVIGGESGAGITQKSDSKVLRYEPIRNRWTRGLSPIPINSDGLAADTIEGRVYVVGTGEHLQIYDPVTDEWTQGAPLPVPTKGPSVAVVNKELYVFGGGSTIVISSVQIYDPETNMWRLSTDLSAPRDYSAAAVHDGSAYIFGGHGPPELDLSDNEQLILLFP